MTSPAETRQESPECFDPGLAGVDPSTALPSRIVILPQAVRSGSAWQQVGLVDADRVDRAMVRPISARRGSTGPTRRMSVASATLQQQERLPSASPHASQVGPGTFASSRWRTDHRGGHGRRPEAGEQVPPAVCHRPSARASDSRWPCRDRPATRSARRAADDNAGQSGEVRRRTKPGLGEPVDCLGTDAAPAGRRRRGFNPHGGVSASGSGRAGPRSRPAPFPRTSRACTGGRADRPATDTDRTGPCVAD